MGKAYSVGAKKRNKKGTGGKRAMFRGIGQVQEAMREAEAMVTEDPRDTVAEARARVMGRKSTAGMLDAKLCHPAGMAVYLSDAKDSDILWQTFIGYDSAEQTYFRRIIGRPRFPNVAKMEYLPETLYADADDTPDTRSTDEKDRDAANGWARWQGFMGHLPGFQRRAIIRASWQMDELQKGGRLTVHGQAFIAAIRSLADVVEAG